MGNNAIKAVPTPTFGNEPVVIVRPEESTRRTEENGGLARKGVGTKNTN